MAKIKLDRDRRDRIRGFVKENRAASFGDVARHFGTTVREIEDNLRPPGRHGLPMCDELFCANEAYWGFPNGNFCSVHKGNGK